MIQYSKVLSGFAYNVPCLHHPVICFYSFLNFFSSSVNLLWFLLVKVLCNTNFGTVAVLVSTGGPSLLRYLGAGTKLFVTILYSEFFSCSIDLLQSIFVFILV